MPPSRGSLLLLLRGLTAQLQNGMAADVLPHAVDAAQRLVLDMASEAEAAAAADGGSAAATAETRWPPLDAEVAAAALELLLACHSAAVAHEQQAAEGNASSCIDGAGAAAAVQQAAQGMMLSLCTRQEALSPTLRAVLLHAIWLGPGLLKWATTTFGPSVIDDLSAEAGASALRLNLQSTETDEPPVLSPEAQAAAQWRQERLADVERVRDHKQMQRHLLKYGWILRKGMVHRVYRMEEEGLPGHPEQTYTHASTSANWNAIENAKSTLRNIYKALDEAHRAAAKGGAEEA
ncbi:hypothetical protein C2E21_3332 [Chlorella sorokiniana]|uniref:Uncharacterized protein n=1 Tax=Chlorella sorokiniana TaxID=3076 RepID=A0A2P6TU22_CHLSO|nr:hypothetical protein C2E21_3332 [Chlorella sorokiniana]|eukprot:PRW57570.1 hypothetical protein C2E21_3332 [Chlorella sorokiniana]